MSKPVLLSNCRGSCTWRVRIVLEAKKIPYVYQAVELKPVDGEQVAIMQYLEEKYPEPRLLPADPYLRAKCREVVELIVSGIQPLQGYGLIPFIGKAEWKKVAAGSNTRGFTAIETILAETAGKYCFGDEVTFADACLVPQVHNAYLFRVDMTPFPTIQRIYAALQHHPLIKKADASCQPDTPPTGIPSTP